MTYLTVEPCSGGFQYQMFFLHILILITVTRKSPPLWDKSIFTWSQQQQRLKHKSRVKKNKTKKTKLKPIKDAFTLFDCVLPWSPSFPPQTCPQQSFHHPLCLLSWCLSCWRSVWSGSYHLGDLRANIEMGGFNFEGLKTFNVRRWTLSKFPLSEERVWYKSYTVVES